MCSSTPLPCPAALLKPPLTYLAIPQWPVLELLILRAFTPDMPLRRAGTPERRVGKHRQEKETSQGKKQVLRGTEPAEELLQTTLVLPWEPRPLSKELCSLLTSLGQERPSPVTNPCSSHLLQHRRCRESKNGQKPSAWMQTVPCTHRH